MGNKENKMFCFQCQETAGCSGCTVSGVCGKKPDVAAMQDLLVYVTKGLSAVTTELRFDGKEIEAYVNEMIIVNLFTTITNANFDKDSIIERIKNTLATKEELIRKVENREVLPEAALWKGTEADFEAKASRVGILSTENEDIRSLRELITYGLKGLAAYAKHAAALAHTDVEIDAFLQRALAATLDDSLSADQLTALTLETGSYGVKVMELLDKANTETYGNPEITKVNIGVGKNPGILVSGHDLRDLEMLLEQTQGTGVDVYTHSEMLPAHYYPAFKKYSNFIGNYGNAWWKQKEEFERFHGPILMTTNCIVPPKDSYKDRMYTTGAASYPGWSATSNTGRGVTGSVVNAVSSVGVVDAVGRVWEWLDELITRAEHATNADYHASVAWGWDKKSPLNTGEKSYDVGNIYQYYAYSLAALVAGGSWSFGAYCGARAVDCHDCPWGVNTYVGARGACDSL